MRKSLHTFVGICALCSVATVNRAAWPEVPTMDWERVSVDDFADNELEVPYLLEHFHTVANAVVEEGPTRGFLAIKVNREPKDNEPYNARIQENHLALAYFYGTKRPWNPYYGSDAVRVRLEAMLEYWCSIQNPQTGLFAEYTPANFSLAPTGFGVAHVSRTLELLASGGTTIDAKLLDRVIKTQRKAILALLTRDDVFEWTHSWSNQHTGVFRAALSFLKMHPDDTELRAALLRGAKRAVEVSQSPAGFLYESAGPDIGYSSVHERYMGFADGFIEQDAEAAAIFAAQEALWGRWLEYNLLPQPGEPLVFLANGAVHTRTNHSIQTPRLWPQAKHQASWVAFQMTDAERAAQVSQQRAALRSNWPTFKPLAIPSAYAYIPTPLFQASTGESIWTPSREERDYALSSLPCNASDRFTRQAYDARRKWSFTYVRRPDYYAAFAAGTPQARQTFGLSLLWNPSMGTVLQGVAGSEWTCGDVGEDGKAVSESKSVDAKFTVNANQIAPAVGWKDFPVGDATASYAVSGGGEKNVTFESDAVRIAVSRPGNITERFPLLVRDGDQITINASSVRIARGNLSFTIALEGGAKATLGEKSPVGRELPGYARILCTVSSNDRLAVKLRFEAR